MNERDMMYGGYYQNLPGNMMYGNFGFQGMPGSLMNNGMMNNYPNFNDSNFGTNTANNPLMEINTRLYNLETRVRLLEQRLGNNESLKEDNNSMYMI